MNTESKKILITGGSGLVGQKLTQRLLEKGYKVSILSRKNIQNANISYYQWDIEKGYINPEALQGVHCIMHLAGAGVADKTWTKERKWEILESRIRSTELLCNSLKELDEKPLSFISASAIGIYGDRDINTKLTENSSPGNGFLAEVTQLWEKSVDSISDLGIRVAKIRIGIVLSTQGGALPKICQPIKLGAGASLGSGEQGVSWIHIDDLCDIFIYALENSSIQGAYNAVAPEPVDNYLLTKAIAKQIKKPLLLPNVPSFVMKLMLGEMASMVLEGNWVSAEKILAAGFKFKFPNLNKALQDLLP